jgi:hypothetical protein
VQNITGLDMTVRSGAVLDAVKQVIKDELADE